MDCHGAARLAMTPKYEGFGKGAETKKAPPAGSALFLKA